MTVEERAVILNRAKTFFRSRIVESHVKNTTKLKDISEFNVNPFTLKYLANFFTGNISAESMAKCLIYPRVLGTSISTSFGTHLQYFCSEVLQGYASAISGLDLEFMDHIDGRKKYCQIKAGPNCINKDDIVTIKNHFNGIRNLARVNRMKLEMTDLVVGVFYGEWSELSQHYLNINKDYPVFVGKSFWQRLTGDQTFYFELINAFGEVATEVDGVSLLEQTIEKLADHIEKLGY